MTLRTLNYGNYGIFLIMGNAGFCPSTVLPRCGITYSSPVSLDTAPTPGGGPIPELLGFRV